MSEDHSLFWDLPVVASNDSPDPGTVIRGRLEFRNFEPVVQMIELLAAASGDEHPDEEWDELCAFYQVDPDEQREFRAALRARLDEENE